MIHSKADDMSPIPRPTSLTESAAEQSRSYFEGYRHKPETVAREALLCSRIVLCAQKWLSSFAAFKRPEFGKCPGYKWLHSPVPRETAWPSPAALFPVSLRNRPKEKF